MAFNFVQTALDKLKKTAVSLGKNVTGYFDPTSNQGNNFWSSTTGKGLANLQKTGLQDINPQKYGEFLRTSTDYYQSKLPESVSKYTKPIANMAANTAQTVGTGAYNIFKGSGQTTRGVIENNPLTALKGLANVAVGTGQTIVPASPLFQIPNISTNLPVNKTTDIPQRFAQGFLNTISQANLPETIESRNVKLKLPILGEVEFDPAKSVGGMFGYVKNPTNEQLYKITSSVFNDSKITNLIGKGSMILTKGGIEGFVQGLSSLPDNATEDEIVKHLTNQIIQGAASELFFRSAGAIAKKIWSGFKPYLGGIEEHWNTPVVTMELDAQGNRITVPMWKYKLRNFGLNVEDINKLSEDDYNAYQKQTQKYISENLSEPNVTKAELSEVKAPKLQTKLSKQKAEAQLAELQKNKGLQKVGEVTGATKEGVLPSDIVKPSDNLPSKSILPKREYNINATKLKIKPEEEAVLRTTINEITPELEKAKGTKLSNKEVVDAAKKSDLLTKVTVREQTLEANAQMLKARQNMVSLDKDVEQALKNGDTVKLKTKLGELIDSLKVVSAEAADRGRKLQSLAIEAGDESVRASILKDVTKIETDSEKILKEAVNVDWDNAKDVATFYRKFIKPTAGEVFDEFRYNNMLSNPRTHLRNAFSNLVQTFVTRPATLMTQGKFAEAGEYYSAVFKNLPDATKAFTDSFGGKTAISKPDIEHIPTQKLPKFLTIPTRAMEASDRFFTKLISEGELARGATVKEAQATAEYSLFRQGLKPEGQGAVLNAIDSATEGVYEMGRKIPILRWFVPFVRTPMNFAKQWIEYSPAGLSTIPGAGNKGEQLAKVVVGSIVTAVGASVALNDRTTWSVPTDPTEKELFYASGRKPYSIKIGDNWVSMQYAGPFAFALALPAAVKYYEEQNRTAMTDDQMTKLGKIASSMAEYLSGQTFMEGLGNFVSLIKGDTDYTLGKNLGYTAGQLIPLNGLVRWVSTMIDPIYRKSTTAGEQLISGIPGLSKTLEPYTMPEGQPSTRETRNLFTPYDVTKSKPQYEPMLTKRSAKLQQNAVKNKAKKELEKNKDGTQQISENEVMYWNEDTATVKTLDLSPVKEPTYTGDEILDKKLKSGYKSKLNSQMNAVIDAYEAGVIPLEMAKELVNNIQKTYDSVTPKSNKFTVKKVSYSPKAVNIKSMGDLLSSSKSVKLKRKKYKFKRTL